jgi:iron complex outermembrane receptor protein
MNFHHSVQFLMLLSAPPETAIPPLHQTVVVTGAYQPVPLEEHERAVCRLPARKLGPLGSTISDSLRLDSSLDLRERAPGGVQAGISIRGSTFGQTLILVDGVRVSDAQSANHNLDLPLPVEAIERIEVLRGSGSAIHGSDAIGGVVNVITRPREYSGFQLRAAGGNQGINQQRAAWSLLRGPVSQQLAFSRDFSSGFTPNRDYRSLALSSVTWLTSGAGETHLLLGHSDRPFGAQNFYGNFPSWERTKAWFASASQTFGKQTSASYSFRRHTDLFVLYRDQPERFTNRHAVESWNFSLRRHERLGANQRFHYGAEAFSDSITSNNLGQHQRAYGAGYAAWDVRALRRVSFTLGLRSDFTRSFDLQFNPTFSAGYWLSEHWKVRGSVSRAFRLPTYTDLYYHDPANLGSPDLLPELAWNFETGADWHAGTWRGGVTVFHRRDREVIDYVRPDATAIWRATNIHSINFTGLESSAHWRNLDLHYTWINGAQQALEKYESKYVLQYPEHYGVASYTIPLAGRLAARTRIGAVQRYRRGPYAVWDAAVAWTRHRVQPFAQFTNLTSTYYEEFTGVRNPPRVIVLGLEFRLAKKGIVPFF